MKKSDLKVLSISLAEVVLMLFFLVLLALAAREKTHNNEMHDMREEQKRMMAEMEKIRMELNEFMAVLPDEPDYDRADTVLVSMSRIDYIPQAARDNLEGMAEKIRAYREMINRLRQVARRNGQSVSELITVMKNFRTGRSSHERQIRELEQRVATLQQILANSGSSTQGCELENRDLKNINRELAQQLATCSNGEGFPPCWRSAGGDIQYMYDIYIGNNGLSVHRAWPLERETEMNTFTGAERIAETTVDIEKFLAVTRDVFAKSQKQQCRYFVRIHGEKSAMNARMFTYYQEIQNHFYHLNLIR